MSVMTMAAVLVACGTPEKQAAEYLAHAEELYRQGKYTEARLEAQNASRILPKNAAAQFLLARIAERDQDSRVMVQHLMMAVAADPGLVPARVRLGTLYFLAGVYDKAEEEARAAATLAPADAEVRVLNARVLLHRNDKVAATRELDAAMAADPDLVEAIVLRASAAAASDPAAGLAILDAALNRVAGDKAKPLRQFRIAILARQDRKAEVEQALSQLNRDFPGDQELQYELARFYSSESRLDDAERVMRGAAKLAPDDVNAQLNLAQFLAQMRSPEAAEQALEALVKERPDEPAFRLALGRHYEGNGKPDAALSVYGELAGRDPKSKAGVTARVRTAALRIGRDEIDQASEVLNGVLGDAPNSADALLLRAGLRFEDGKFQDAMADVRAVLRQEPTNAQAMLLLARTYVQLNERTLARDSYRRLMAMDPKNAEAPQGLGMLEVMDGKPKVGEEVLRAHLKVVPDDLNTAGQLVVMLTARKAWSQAETEARRIEALPNDRGLGQFQLGRLFRAQGRKAEAAAAFGQSLAANPQSPVALEAVVFALQDLGRQAEAAEALREFRRRYPDDPSAQLVEGRLAAANGDTATAAKIFDAIVLAKPRATKVWVALADLSKNDANKRIDVFRRAMAANPGNADLGLLLGTEYQRAGRYEEAIQHFQNLLKANPGVPAAANNLAALLLDYRIDAGSHARALEIAKALATTDNPAMLDTVGWAYYRNKQFPVALEYLEQAVGEAEEVPVIRYHLGMAYLAANDRERAREELQRAVRGDGSDFPGRAEARVTLDRL